VIAPRLNATCGLAARATLDASGAATGGLLRIVCGRPWGLGSDLDLVFIVQASSRAFWERSVQWPLETMIVPAEALIYTEEEWRQKVAAQIPRAADVCWVWPPDASAQGD
jgi:hypothetical protein